ncbi:MULTISPECIES: VWA domain-containing protein [unclassified Oceanispirochaeta]|uniref:VWA domain-containing protein n=1 Tax=unclassified Oceanispirochaeta TaxID=2635722 RepID=UPI000E091924|nr:MULTISPECIES: VWA domain-containing protein [unclassified Oceanispirochaeta]MBF9018429.1 VWA domain-containing protein [Oceanispirochaeta sp. M2]NPD74860.1 VWA domain-containing protein [Oceanispirochaeta sp. M1]RDG29301.1 VWA domain-containing protein [Oceanispirochaeta sp. M1]
MSFFDTEALLWAIPSLLFPLFFIIGRIRRRRYRIFMSGNGYGRGSGGSISFPFSLFFMILSICFLILAMLRPVSNPRLKDVEQSGRNLVFVIDVSRSMLAEDLAPNRLERARYDILNSMDALSGNRVALVAFAGSPVLKCPLTLDYTYFSQALSDLGLNSVSRGGTNLGDAVRIVIDELFDPEDRQAMDIILITDGEDQDSFPVQSAARAGQEGIRIIALGLGNQESGAAVPGEDESETLSYQNEPVYSRADMKTLEEMAAASRDGWAVAVESGRLPVPAILQKLYMKGENKNTGKAEQYVYDEHYRWALIPALLFFILALLSENTVLFRRNE